MKNLKSVGKESISIIDEIFLTKARQKIVSGVTGFLGVSLLGMSAIIASIRPEDIYPSEPKGKD